MKRVVLSQGPGFDQAEVGLSVACPREAFSELGAQPPVMWAQYCLPYRNPHSGSHGVVVEPRAGSCLLSCCYCLGLTPSPQPASCFSFVSSVRSPQAGTVALLSVAGLRCL